MPDKLNQPGANMRYRPSFAEFSFKRFAFMNWHSFSHYMVMLTFFETSCFWLVLNELLFHPKSVSLIITNAKVFSFI